MPASTDSPYREPRLAFENLPNSLDLVLHGPQLASSKPGERLDIDQDRGR